VVRDPLAEGRPAARLTRPLREFLDTEIAGGVILLVAVIIALLWANSPWNGAYQALWRIGVRGTGGLVPRRIDGRPGEPETPLNAAGRILGHPSPTPPVKAMASTLSIEHAIEAIDWRNRCT
jgi:Na+/H+ antiporter 1